MARLGDPPGTHIAIYEHLEGSGVNWMKPVSEEQYRR
jgi:hypothetical protein